MATSTSEPTIPAVTVSLWLGFAALAATFLKALETMFLDLFTLVPDSELAWGFWVAAILALLSFAGMMATLYVLDQKRTGMMD